MAEKMKRIVVFLLAATLILSLCAVLVSAKEGHALDLVISTEGEGEEITVSVTVENVKETLHVVEYVVAYDAEKLELVNAVDEEGALDCITALPKNWENFVSVQAEGRVTALALTAGMDGLKSGELKFEFKFRVKEGATGEAKIEIADEDVLGSYVGIDNNDIKEFGGKGGSVSIGITDNGAVGEVSTDTVSMPEAEEEGSSLSIIIIVSVIAVLVVGAVVATFVILKKKN
jgi:hypothetical protein